VEQGDEEEEEDLLVEGNVIEGAEGAFTGYESSEEDFPTGITRNTVGKIPLEWYDDYDHLGYDVTGKKIFKSVRRDQIDEFLAKNDDPLYWKTLRDEVNGRDVVLTDAQLEILRKIQSGEAAEPEFDQYENLVTYENPDWFHPLSNKMKPKSSFQPSKWESQRVAYLVQAMRKGWIKLDEEKPEVPKIYQMWNDDELEISGPKSKAERRHIPAPKMKLPGHAESYRPPVEYLLNEQELERWENQDPDDRETNFVPKQHDSLRHVGTYPEAIRERFHRCLDMYMCPRQTKMKMNVDPEKLLPKLPSAKDLRPFPTHVAVEYIGHSDLIRSMDLSPDNQWLVTGSDDKTVRVWDVETGRCVHVWEFETLINCVKWNPNQSVAVIAVALESGVMVVTPPIATPSQEEQTASLFRDPEKRTNKWTIYKSNSSAYKKGKRMFYKTGIKVNTVQWHRKGDYLLSLSTKDKGPAILLHRLTTRKTQAMFKKTKGDIQDAAFHPTKPWLILVTQKYLRVYDLMTQQLRKKMQGNTNWFSKVVVHPGGDHVVTGSFDRRVGWFDLDMGATPYKNLRYHREGVPSVCFHPKLPLFASCSHDGQIHIFHGQVYDTYDKDPLIVPVKILKGHEVVDFTGVLDIVFHRSQPWIFSCGADKTAKLWTD
jgi:ribosome biogenesis protein ERB1